MRSCSSTLPNKMVGCMPILPLESLHVIVPISILLASFPTLIKSVPACATKVDFPAPSAIISCTFNCP